MTRKLADPAIVRAVARQIRLGYTTQADIARRAQVSKTTLHAIADGEVVEQKHLDRVIAALGLRLTTEGELEWNDSLASAITQPAAQRDRHAVYRQQAHEFIKSWAPRHDALAKTYLSEAVERGLITPQQARDIYAHIWDLPDG